jgi:hypothetical protein
MAQTRRVEKHNEKAYLLSAPRFSPYLSGQFTPFIRSPTKECQKLSNHDLRYLTRFARHSASLLY